MKYKVGEVKEFDYDKLYGFVTRPGEKDLLFHLDNYHPILATTKGIFWDSGPKRGRSRKFQLNPPAPMTGEKIIFTVNGGLKIAQWNYLKNLETLRQTLPHGLSHPKHPK